MAECPKILKGNVYSGCFTSSGILYASLRGPAVRVIRFFKKTAKTYYNVYTRVTAIDGGRLRTALLRVKTKAYGPRFRVGLRRTPKVGGPNNDIEPIGRRRLYSDDRVENTSVSLSEIGFVRRKSTVTLLFVDSASVPNRLFTVPRSR